MKKNFFRRNGKIYYLLGVGEDGHKYYLESAHFDCGWYWGIGYIESFTNDKCPVRAKTIRTHSHFSTTIFERGMSCFNAFKRTFPENPFNDDEIWTICELMKTAYTARHYADTLHIGGSNITTNPMRDLIMSNAEEYKRINESVIPALMNSLYEILMPEGENGK